MNAITLNTGDSYSLSTGQVTRHLPEAMIEDLGTPLDRSLTKNDLDALSVVLRTL